MATPAYTPYDSTVPVSSQTPSAYATDDLENLHALRDGAVCGFIPNFSYSQSGGTDAAPTYRIWSQVGGVLRFRAYITYDGTVTYRPATVKWQWSNDSGATWADMDATATTLTWVTTSDIYLITAVDRNGGLWVLALQAMVAAIRTQSLFNTHSGATGGSVHGLGTMSTQASTSVNIDGGNIDATDFGLSTAAKVDALRVRELQYNGGNTYAVGNGATFTPDANAYEYFKISPSATQSHTMTVGAPSNAPGAAQTQTFKLEIVNGKRDVDARITWNAIYHWVAGSTARPPDTALELSGSNLFTVTWNGASWDISHDGKRG